MDEPTGGLDVSVQARLLDLIRALVAELGLAVLLVTHDIAAARLLAHRMLVMRHGQVVEQGLTDRVLDDPQHPTRSCSSPRCWRHELGAARPRAWARPSRCTCRAA